MSVDCEDVLITGQAVLDANEGLLGTGSRRARKYMTKAILNGDFDGDEYSEMMQPASMFTPFYDGAFSYLSCRTRHGQVCSSRIERPMGEGPAEESRE